MIIIRIYKREVKQYYVKTVHQNGCLARSAIYCVSN